MQTAVRTGNLPAALALRATVVATVVENGAVLLDLDTKYFYTLNESAWAIVRLFETSAAPLKDVLEAVQGWGGSAGETAAFLEQLSAYELVEAANGEAPAGVPFTAQWTSPSIERHADPLQTIVTSAFDPSIPLAE